tara:strand:+ start:1057 stop:1953 length:897 start_codon:yes stop_codon:yes gene_type:complete
MSSLNYRYKRINLIEKKWKFKKVNPLMVKHQINKKNLNNLRFYIKLYISKSLKINFENNDTKFMKELDNARHRRINITPNGGIVPKRETHLEYNLVLREWANLVRSFSIGNPKLLKRFRTTPNIRIKFGKELQDNKNRPLNTSLPHSDAWVEGPWGMNCFVPIMGDIENNSLVYYKPINFRDEYLKTSKTYSEMQWVMKNYRMIKFKPKIGNVYVSDYSLIHNTIRKKNCKTRVSIDTTIFVGDHKPHKDRLKEYRSTIPYTGVDEFVDAGQYENEKPAEKISTFSHYTSKVIKTVKL